MKKVIALAAMAVLLVPMGASAYEIVVPFFNDGGRVWGDTADTGASGNCTWIYLVNMTRDTLTLGVRYTDINGIPCTPDGNSFEINPLSSWAFRPVAEDTGAERTVDLGGPKQPYAWVDGNNTGQDSDKTSFWRDSAGNGGLGGCALFVLPKQGDTSVTQYPDYENWPDTDTPIFAMVNSYNLYSFLSGAPGGMTAAIKGPKGIE